MTLSTLASSAPPPLPPTDWATTLLRAQVLLAAGRTVAYAATVCHVRRSELEQRLAAAGISREANAAAAARLPEGAYRLVMFPDGLVELGGRGEQEEEQVDGDDGPLLTVLTVMESARSSLDFEFCELTCNLITDAVLRIHARPEAEVRVITNKQSAELEGSCVPRLVEAGVPIRSRNKLHAAFCIIDGKTVIQGSSDWTQAVEHSAVTDVRIHQSPALTNNMTRRFLWSDEDDPPLTEEQIAENRRANEESGCRQM